ncbi:sulfite oxidase-like [Schistocerca nitens]|uniref:sulfite oxidase-like n=1 Tax=Schistocerca nitens TaxID=7011 RepID=UPI002117CBDA|nr:sulfite oxidase-like [Schistocerca nitens]
MNRSILFRHTQSIHSYQLLKQSCEALGTDKKQLLRFFSGGYKPKANKYVLKIAAATLGITATWGLYSHYRGKGSFWDAVASISETFQNKKQLRQYSLNDVAAHSNRNTGIWVTYNCGVYDITDYIEHHPGGDNVLLAAGGSLEPYWMKYPVHKNPSVLSQLEKYKIGTLENCEETGAASQINEKPKSSSKKNNIPDVDPASYALKIDGLNDTSLKIRLNTLKNDFHRHTVTTVLKCSGNCKSGVTEVKENQWSGARLIDVLKAAGYDQGHTGVQNIQFEGLDLAVPGMHYGTIISFEKAMDPKSDIILAYELNGEPLTKENGFPIRVLMPGIPAGRQVKWLGRIIILGDKEDSL